jgi:hypothetical protein
MRKIEHLRGKKGVKLLDIQPVLSVREAEAPTEGPSNETRSLSLENTLTKHEDLE